MSAEPVLVEPDLREWLTRADPPRATGWEADPPPGALHCHPDLVARLTEIARSLDGTARVFVAGCPVVHARGGPPVAAASGTSWLVVRSARPAGELASRTWHTTWLDPAWVDLDPWPADIAFARGLDQLRGHLAHALQLVGVT